MRNRWMLYAAALPLVCVCACGATKTTAPELPSDVEALRATLAPYASLTLAKNAGYTAALTDCMSMGDQGAMGFHFGNPSLIDGNLDANRPEVLLYEPGKDGSMSLVAVEFVVPFAIMPKSGPAPVLYGQKFIPDDVFGLWTLHVWTHKSNPNGLFAQWNPRVHC